MNKKNAFAAIGKAARELQQPQQQESVQPEVTPEPLPQVQPEPPINQPVTTPQKTNSRKRQGGKRSDPNYRQTTIYINMELDKKMKAAFLEDEIADFSEWVEKRIEEWLKERSKK